MGGKNTSLLTFDERKCIERLIKDKWKTGSIASELGRSHACIKTEVARNGGRDSYNAQKSQARREIIRKAQAQKISKGFTEEQVKIIHQSIQNDLSINKISEILQVSNFRVSKYVHDNFSFYKKKNYTHFIDRIEAIESHLDILFELIKEKK